MVIVNFAGYDYDITDPIIVIGSTSFDVRKAEEWTNSNILSTEGELARLYLDILGHPEYTRNGDVIPEKKGIDLATESFINIVNYLNVPPTQISESSNELCRRVMSMRFPTDFNNEINLVSDKVKNEYQLIKNHVKNTHFLGCCGFNGHVRLDGSIPTKRKTNFIDGKPVNV